MRVDGTGSKKKKRQKAGEGLEGEENRAGKVKEGMKKRKILGVKTESWGRKNKALE